MSFTDNDGKYAISIRGDGLTVADVGVIKFGAAGAGGEKFENNGSG